MDIMILLWLQAFRESINNALTPFMEGISLFAVTYLIMFPTFIYWIIDKTKGLYTLVTYYFAVGINALVKLTCCVYRPWIRDPRVVPAGDAITTATGYSFPSGHTMTAGPIYGGIATTYWKEKRWISIVCIILLLITGFSRNYLGVHTPQDVLVGLLLSLGAIWLMSKIFPYLREHPEKENIMLLAMFILGWAGIAYITFKPYPMDYVDGVLLVDPQKMMNDGYGDISCMIAFPIARYIERRWINFESPGLNTKGITVGIVGLIPMWAMIKYMKAPLDQALGSHWGHFTYTMIVVMYVIALFPLIIKLICGNKEAAVTETTESAE